MGDIHIMELRASVSIELPTPDNDETAQKTGEVVRVNFGRSAKTELPTVFNNLETMLKTYGVDFGQSKIRKDFKIIEHLVQGMMDRSNGGTLSSSSACLILDALRHTLGYEEEEIQDDTQELFGDLLDQID